MVSVAFSPQGIHIAGSWSFFSGNTFLERSSLDDLELAFGLVKQTIIEPVSYSFAFLSPVLSR